MRVLAFDPGKTTGWALVDGTHYEGGELLSWYGADRLIIKLHPDVVVVESFRLFPHMAKTLIGSTFPTVEVIGTLKYMTEHHMGCPLVLQEPSEAKQIRRLPPKERLPIGHKLSPHEKSALQHAILYLKRQGMW